jgi:Domain of unknown function (DUF4326)
MPQRIQRKRTKGWRMPEGAVYVGRPSRWGNPNEVGYGPGAWFASVFGGEKWFETEAEARQCAVDAFRSDLLWDFSRFADLREDYLWRLRGRDLACWCPIDQPCHADVLLELANGGA